MSDTRTETREALRQAIMNALAVSPLGDKYDHAPFPLGRTADALLDGPLAALLRDGDRLRAKIERVKALCGKGEHLNYATSLPPDTRAIRPTDLRAALSDNRAEFRR